ncbi:hypothetical protein T439DRAFT_382950 [Meredithblackwellia eburnea MCA 4105]
MPRPHGSSTKGKHIKHSEFVLEKGAACLQCKARKVRCSGEGEGVCTSCVRHARHEGKDLSECVCEWADKRSSASSAARKSRKAASSSSKTQRSRSPSHDSDGNSSEASSSSDHVEFDLSPFVGPSTSTSSWGSPSSSQISILPSFLTPQTTSPVTTTFKLPSLQLPPPLNLNLVLPAPVSEPQSYFAPDLPLYYPSSLSTEDEDSTSSYSPTSSTYSYTDEQPFAAASTFAPPPKSEMSEAEVLALLSLPTSFTPAPVGVERNPMELIDYSQFFYPQQSALSVGQDELWGGLLMA